jgi:hypothetical protein
VPAARKHLRNARRHFEAAVTAGADPITRAWASVALFYAAHQLVHAVLDGEQSLAEDVRHPQSHGSGPTGPLGTNTLVARAYRGIDLHYRSLYYNGLAVRYNGAAVPEADFEAYMTVDYTAIAAWARSELTRHGRALEAAYP